MVPLDRVRVRLNVNDVLSVERSKSLVGSKIMNSPRIGVFTLVAGVLALIVCVVVAVVGTTGNSNHPAVQPQPYRISYTDNFLHNNAREGAVPAMDFLDLSFSDVTDEGLKVVATMTNLKQLRLTGCSRITDAGLAHLSKLTKLTDLCLNDTKITDAGLVHLSKMKSLQSLELGWTKGISDAGLVHLSDLTELIYLGLSKTQVTDAGLVHLQKLTKLSWIKLALNKGITDKGLPHLIALPGLKLVNLAMTEVTEAGLDGANKARPGTEFNFHQ